MVAFGGHKIKKMGQKRLASEPNKSNKSNEIPKQTTSTQTSQNLFLNRLQSLNGRGF
jgi:hypothetical protein